MRDGLSRRQWLLGLLTVLGGWWLQRLAPAAPGPGAAPAPPPLAPPRPAVWDSPGQVTTYTYDGARLLAPVAAHVTTYAYDGHGRTLFPRGETPS